MGRNLIEFAPAVDADASTDDAFNVPGALKLDGTQDTADPVRVEAGAYSFADPDHPTLVELASATHWNQVIGLVNYRVGLWHAAFGTDLGALSYLSADARITAAQVAAITAKIDSLRSAEGFTAYSWPTIASGGRILGAHLAHLRKALRLAGRLTLTDVSPTPRVYVRSDFGSTQNDTVYLVLDYESSVGVFYRNSLYRRFRRHTSHKIPSWASTGLLSATFSSSLSGNTYAPEDYEALLFAMWPGNTTDPTAVADWRDATLETIGGRASPTIGYVALDPTAVAGRAGNYLCLRVSTRKEIENRSAGTSESGLWLWGSGSGNRLSLDFGD
jgi:hypothetical protein